MGKVIIDVYRYYTYVYNAFFIKTHIEQKFSKSTVTVTFRVNLLKKRVLAVTER